MQDQNIPTTANRPDFNQLKQTTVGLNDSVNQTIERLFPDNTENSTLKALKNIVAQFMMAPNSANDPRTWGPLGTYKAMVGVSDAIDKDPKLINAALVRTMTNVAVHDGEAGTGDGTPWPDGRLAAQKVLTTIVEKRPDLANAALVKNVVQSATHDPDSEVRLNAQRTLSQIAEKRPDLIDADMVKAVRNTAAAPLVDHAQRPSDGMPWVYAGKLSGNQWDRFDNEARETAQDTMKTIADKRPDLMASAQPAITKPVIVAKQTGMSLHATPAAPRPTLMTP